jgi:hypothetical protein
LAATIAPAPCSWLRLAFLAPCRPHLICRPSGHSNQSYLSLHHPEATLAKTFHTCSSPATTQTKPHPTLVVLDQESVHTMLSITHHWGATIQMSDHPPFLECSWSSVMDKSLHEWREL